MRYRRYPAYKDSGVEWLGEVPAHWSCLKLKRLVEMRSGDAIPGEQISGTGLYPVYGGNGIRGYTDFGYIHEGTLPLIGRQGALCGNINYSSGKFWASEHAVVVSPRTSLSIKWLGELLRSMNLNQYSISAAQPGLSVEMISNLVIPVPPDSEQIAIAAFLDDQTAKIDALIAKQERLIALLQEKRQALISHVVTKGLNPHAPMKDSGVEWLGEAPAHWNIIKFGRCLNRIEAGWTPDSLQQLASDDEWAVVKVGCVRDGEFFPDEHKVLAPGVPPALDIEIQAGDLIMSRANTTELVGSIGLVRQTRPRLTLCDKTYRLILNGQLLTTYANYLLRARVARHQIELAASGASPSMKNISQESVRALLLPVPPVTEQQRIVCHLDKSMANYGKITQTAEGTIALLQERRAALISAAVTGKIDVRDHMN